MEAIALTFNLGVVEFELSPCTCIANTVLSELSPQLCLFVCDKISDSPRWPQTHRVAEDNVEPLIFQSPSLKHWDDRYASLHLQLKTDLQLKTLR